jgi:ribonuclease Z
MLMRLNLDKVTHPIHCYYPASGKVYFDRLRYGTAYYDRLNVVEHPVEKEGIVHDDGHFKIEAKFLDHGLDNLGWRIQESSTLKFDKQKLKALGIEGAFVKQLQEKGFLLLEDKKIQLKDVSSVREGDIFSCVIDTRYCANAVALAKGAKMFLCESTYLEEHRDLAYEHYHLTAKQAAEIAKKAQVEQLILTHYSARYRNVLAFEEEAKKVFPNSYAADDFKCFPFPR